MIDESSSSHPDWSKTDKRLEQLENSWPDWTVKNQRHRTVQENTVMNQLTHFVALIPVFFSVLIERRQNCRLWSLLMARARKSSVFLPRPCW